MSVSLITAKNGETTATINNLYLHSFYNPTKEAQRFVDSLSVDYTPPFIILVEPGIGYCIPPLREKFPKSKIIIIRLSEELIKYNNQGDIIINYFDKQIDLYTKFNEIMTEGNLINSLFLQWPPSSTIFKELLYNFSIDIKNCFEKAKTILITRENFEKKWFLNSISFINYSKHLYKLNKKIKSQILIISSGPSLKDTISIIKNNQKYLFIIALSSAIKVCLNNDIIPDLVITTDGGYWAGQHLKSLYKFNIPVAIPVEAFIQRSLLNNIKTIPLDYGDGISSLLLKNMGIKTMSAKRNGTVSGTALEFALENSESDIYIAGLDLATQKGFQHCQPNENDLNNEVNDNRLNPKSKRNTLGEFNNNALDLYKDWFNNYNLNNRKVFRIINNQYKKNTLGEIIDIKSDEFTTKIIHKQKDYNSFEKLNVCKDSNSIIDFIDKYSNSSFWNENLYPLSMCTLAHNNKNSDIECRIADENNKILLKIRKLLND